MRKERNSQSKAASVLGKKSVKLRKERLGEKGFRDRMSWVAKHPRKFARPNKDAETR